MSSYVFYGSWDKISDHMLKTRVWNKPEPRSISISNVSSQAPVIPPDDHHVMTLKAGENYAQKVAVTFKKNPDSLKPEKQPQDNNLVKGTVRKVTSKNKETSFDIMALMIGNGQNTIIILQTKDPEQMTMPKDMKDFIQSAKNKKYLQPATSDALKEQFENQLKMKKGTAIRLRSTPKEDAQPKLA